MKPSLPQRRRPQPASPQSGKVRTIVIEDEPSNIWKIMLFIMLLALGCTAIYFHLKGDSAESNLTANPSSVRDLHHMLDPTGRPADEIAEEPTSEPIDILPPTIETVVLNELSPFDSFKAFKELQLATRKRFTDGLWREHFASLTQSCLTSLSQRPSNDGSRPLDGLIQKKALPLALAQLEIKNRLGLDKFVHWTATSPDFAVVLLTDLDRIELLINNLAIEDDLANVLSIWEKLEQESEQPRLQKRYRNLALSLALIYDKGNRYSEAQAAYQYYAQADRKGNLYVDFNKISPDELVFGVATPVFGLAGMEWALDKFSFSNKDLGKAYSQVPYRLNHPPYPEYTIQNVMELGGVCVEQARVSLTNARAHGVPSADLGGMGTRGGHAWFAYRKPDGTWDNSTGRYNDGYACGTTPNPQTGKSMREWDFFLFNSRGRRNGSREAALTITRAAKILADAGDTAGQLDLLGSAAKRDATNPFAWHPYLNELLRDSTERPLPFWENLVREYRHNLRDFPDHFAIIEEIEAKKIFPKKEPDQIARMLRSRRRETLRNLPDRFDLIVNSVKREIEFYRTTNDTPRIINLYRNTFEDVGPHIPTFLAIAQQFSLDANTYPEIRRRTLSAIEKVFEKEIDSKLQGDVFRLPMEAKACSTIADLFDGEKEITAAAKKKGEAAN